LLSAGDKVVTGRQQCRCILPEAVYTVKSALEDGRVCRPKHVELRADLKRSINGICCNLMVAHVVRLHTFFCRNFILLYTKLPEIPNYGKRIFSEDANNNNNNIYLLQLGRHPVAVVILHAYKT